MIKEEKLEGYADIGDSIFDRRTKERNYDRSCYGRVLPGVGRMLCTLETQDGRLIEKTIWVTYEEKRGVQPIASSDFRLCRNHSIVTNTNIFGIGYKHNVNCNIGNVFVKNIYIHDYATYTPSNENYLARNMSVTIPGGAPRKFFAFLENLRAMADRIRDVIQRKKALELQMKREEEARKAKRLAEEKARKEAERIRNQQAQAAKLKKEKEAAERLAQLARQEEERKAREQELQRQHEEEQKKKQAEELARLNQEITDTEQAMRRALEENQEASIMWHSEFEAKETPGLDPHQEAARISHIYDGTPLIIEGGPGTGKTTVLVQRVSFLLSSDALGTHQNNLTKAQKQLLSSESSKENNWLFLAPNTLLLNYLQNSMIRIGLQPNQDVNTKTITAFREDMMLAYKLTDPAKKNPFLEYRPSKADKERVLILKPIEAIQDFGRFFVTNLKDAVVSLCALNTSSYSWHQKALLIKAFCRTADQINNLSGLMRLFFDMEQRLKPSLVEIEKSLKDEISRYATIVKNSVSRNESIYTKVQALFNEWGKVAIVAENTDAVTAQLVVTIEEDDNTSVRNLDYDLMLVKYLKTLLPKVALNRLLPTELKPREKKLYSIIENQIMECNLEKMGELKLFSDKFSQVCKGVESNIFSQVENCYKAYRLSLLEHGTTIYDQEYLNLIMKKDNNKRLHIDEESLLIGFVNNLMRHINHNFPARFNALRSQNYINAYKENVKYVIAVDEATDYSLLDYYMIASFRHYDVSSISLCGDLMQGLNKNGITNWRLLEKIGLENSEVEVLDTSYRQSPTLLDMSRKMYFDEMGKDAPYHSSREVASYDAVPLKYIDEDEDNKIEWIANRIVEVYLAKNDEMPSVAIFIGDKENITDFVETISSMEVLEGIKVLDGTNTTIKKCVRVYHLSDVKGMEFEVAFFHNIDSAIAQDDTGLMRRHLYVGISRAASHLAATFNREEGNEDVLKYFDNEATHW